jgi:hypothetical protein
MIPQSRPEVWLSRLSTVTWLAAGSSASTSSGTYRRTGASSATFPSVTRRITAIAVNVLVTEAIRNSVSGRTGSGFSTLVTP